MAGKIIVLFSDCVVNRCPAYNNVDTSCIMVPDPKDPQCCTMPECPLIPPGGTTPSGPTIIRPTQPPAVITNYPTPSPNQLVTPTPARGPDGQTLVPPSQTTQAPAYRSGQYSAPVVVVVVCVCVCVLQSTFTLM